MATHIPLVVGSVAERVSMFVDAVELEAARSSYWTAGDGYRADPYPQDVVELGQRAADALDRET